MTFDDLYCTALTMLLGEVDKFWVYYETDPEWWQLRLWTKRN